MILDPSDTIAAIASPPGRGSRGIVRLSGPSVSQVALVGFTPDQARTAPLRAERRSGFYRLDGLRPTLSASLWLWPGSKSYTGQPSAEIHTVAAPPLLQLVLAHCLSHGARLAEPGEFTLRAFLAGRIDLTRAEAVLGVVEAANPSQLEAALDQLAGGLARPVATLRDRLLDVLAHLEANLDFVDEPDVDLLGRAALAEELARGAEDLAKFADRLRGRNRPDGHPRVALTGPPNAGKSRLFNALIGHEHALVSSQPGTTRDYLSAMIPCDGVMIELIDTAGLADASSPIEARAQTLRAEQTARADLLLACRSFDSDSDWAVDRRRVRCADLFEPSKGQGPHSGPSEILRVRTKCDLAVDALHPPDVIPTSAATGAGLDALRRAIADALRSAANATDLPTTTAARCRDGLSRASIALSDASSILNLGGGEELVAIDLRLAVDELGKVVGAVFTDDVLDRIFRRFCIGK